MLQYIKDNHGIDTEGSYPYHAKNEKCHFKKSDIGATDVGYVWLKTGDDDALVKAIAAHGPISVAIDASLPSFRFYSHGIYDEPLCSPFVCIQSYSSDVVVLQTVEVQICNPQYKSG